MKIRTSFVTNSSGSSSSRVIIENEILYDLLNKYTDKINNRLKEIDNCYINIAKIKDGLIEDNSYYGEGDNKGSFWYLKNDSSIYEIPNEYVNALKKATENYRDDQIINDIFNELKKELEAKQQLINTMYTKLEYISSSSWDDAVSESKTIYDSRNQCPNCGSILKYNHYAEGHGWEYQKILETISCSNPRCSYKINNIENLKDNLEEEYDDEEMPFENNYNDYLN